MDGAGRLGHARALVALFVALGAACAGRSVSERRDDSAGGTGGALTADGGTAAGGGSAADGGTTSSGGSGGGGAVGPGGASGTGASGPVPIPRPPRPPCGNGSHDAGEACDDGNTFNGDGCSEECQVEPSADCPTVGPCTLESCGNGRLGRTEQCDDGNTRGNDGCGSDCVVEAGWQCPGPGVRCRPLCGDSRLKGDEQCDDGNLLKGDGCSEACRTEWRQCPMDLPADAGAAGGPGEAELPADAGAADAGLVDVCVTPLCGDSVVTAPEECDEGARGNDGSYAGCNADCSYAAFCGDGIVNGSEECDTGPFSTQSGAVDCPVGCHLGPYCGDGHIDVANGEQCDDGPATGQGACQKDCILHLR